MIRPLIFFLSYFSFHVESTFIINSIAKIPQTRRVEPNFKWETLKWRKKTTTCWVRLFLKGDVSYGERDLSSYSSIPLVHPNINVPKHHRVQMFLFLSWFDTGNSSEEPNLVCWRSFEMIRQQTCKRSSVFFMLDGWVVSSYVITPSFFFS